MSSAGRRRRWIVPRPAGDAGAAACQVISGAAPRLNYTWAKLMARVFEMDVLECTFCGGRMRILAAIHPPETTRRILEHLHLPTRAPPVKPAIAEPDDDC